MLPWVGEGVTGSQLERLRLLSDIARNDSTLAIAVARLAWFSGGLGENEVQSLRLLLGFVSRDPELARNVANLGWFVDDVNGFELDALYALEEIAVLDHELARISSTLSWFANKMTLDENSAIWALSGLANVDVDLAVEIVDSLNLWSPRLVANSLISLRFFRNHSPPEFNVLAAKPWFADGLSRQDAAFITVLGGAIRWPELYDDLVEAHYVKSTTIDAPVGGQVNVWLFSNKPIDPQDRLLDNFAQAISTAEDFLMVPFPDRDFLVLYADGHDLGAAYNSGSHVVVHRSEGNDQVHPHTVFHETAHHYMYGGLGNTWLVEGGANFIATIGLAQVGIRDLDRWPSFVERSLRGGCLLDPGLGSIQDLNDYQTDFRAGRSCNYVFGEYFLHRLRTSMGHDAIGTALGEVYRTGREARRPLSEETIYDILLKNTPDTLKESLQNAYVELHGGPFVANFEEAESELLIPDALVSELRNLLPWFTGPLDMIHSSGLAAISNVWQLNRRLGLSLAKAPWVVDGIDHGESIALSGFYDIASADQQLTDQLINFSWVRDGVVFWERRAIEAIARLALHTPGDAERVAQYPWVVDEITNEERLLLEFLAEMFVTAEGTGKPAPVIGWMIDGLTDPEHRLLVQLRRILAEDNTYCVEVLALPWIVAGPSDGRGSEERAARGLALLVEADKQLANDVIRLEWVLDGLEDAFEDSALEKIGIVARMDVQEAERIINSSWFRDGIDLNDVLRLQDYVTSDAS